MKQHWARLLPATCFLFAFTYYPGGQMWQLFALSGAWLAAGLIVSDLENYPSQDQQAANTNIRSVLDLITWPKKLI